MAAFCLSIFRFSELKAGTVRTVYSDGVTMLPVSLKMGQSTILRFSEKPKKVVLGNSNYYSVEFIDNDVAIQPIGAATTNLFVYGLKNVYGFLLRTNQTQNYDDLIQVELKENKPSTQTKTATIPSLLKEISRPRIDFLISQNLKITLTKVLRFEKKDFYVFDVLVENLSKMEIDLSKLKVSFTQGKIKFSPQEIVFMNTKIKSGERTAGRIFVVIDKCIEKCIDTGFEIELNNLKARQVIPRRLL